MKSIIQSLLRRSGYMICRTGSVAALERDLQAAEDRLAALEASPRGGGRTVGTHAAELDAARREAHCRHLVQVAMIRYAVQGQRGAHLAVAAADVRPYYDAATAAPLYDSLIEDDFRVFRGFDDPSTTVLDLGANIGLAASSMRNVGCCAAILSFEPNPWHHAALARLRDAWTGGFDFLPLGLGAVRQQIPFTTPVIEDVAIDTLTTADLAASLDWTIPENLVLECLGRFRDVPQPSIRFCETVWTVERLDDALATARVAVPLERIVAVKVDVEGFEAQVLAGATATLSRHRPLVMMEGANRSPDVVACLSALGYRHAELEGDVLRLSDAQSERSNGFFLPADRLEEHRARGVLAG